MASPKQHPYVGRPDIPPVTGKSVGEVLRVLRRTASSWHAPKDLFTRRQPRDPFRTLVACILSLRTKDETTAVASSRLFARAATPQAMLTVEPRTLERLIYPVGFYRTKARAIRQICRDLIERYGGRVPDDIDALLTLKGVGRKTANLVVTEAYRKPGICVDTHVHRITNRWGLVATKTPEASEMALREVLPRRYWLEINRILVAFGQRICQPISPWCSICPVARFCPRIGVIRSR